ncbi:hypothetical protein Dimus_016142, partial [Dionaea muscipula]
MWGFDHQFSVAAAFTGAIHNSQTLTAQVVLPGTLLAPLVAIQRATFIIVVEGATADDESSRARGGRARSSAYIFVHPKTRRLGRRREAQRPSWPMLPPPSVRRRLSVRDSAVDHL